MSVQTGLNLYGHLNRHACGRMLTAATFSYDLAVNALLCLNVTFLPFRNRPNVQYTQMYTHGLLHVGSPTAHSLYMEKTGLFIYIRIQRTHICIVRMGRHKNMPRAYIYNHGAVIKSVRIPQLDNVPGCAPASSVSTAYGPTDLFPTRNLYRYSTPVQLGVLSHPLL